MMVVPSQPKDRRSYWRAYQRRRYRRKAPRPIRERALILLTTFLLTPRELSCALDISTNHATALLRRLWETGRCERWPYRDRSYRYRLRER